MPSSKKAAKSTVVKPGDKLPIAGIDWTVVTSAGKVVKKALPGGGKPNPYCADFKPRENLRDPENGQSLGSVITFGKFRTIDLGDLLWNNEGDLMCPNNPIGTVDLYLVSHHGTDPSGAAALVHALHPRVAIMQNGTRKGGTLQTSQVINSSPGPRGPVAAALVLQRRRRAQPGRTLHRQRRRAGGDRQHPDRAATRAARRRTWRSRRPRWCTSRCPWRAG